MEIPARAPIGRGSRSRRASASRSRASGAFTLIELLVVISVLAILISILLPSLSGARRAAEQSKCASNLHQFGVAANAFANDHKGAMCTGPFDNRRNKNWGSILQKGWVADFVRGEYAIPGQMLCPGNVAESCQNLATTRINDNAYPDPTTGGGFTRERVDQIIAAGYNTNYCQSYYMGYTGALDHIQGNYDPLKISGVVGPLNLARTGNVSTARIPLFGDGRTDVGDTYQVGTKQRRTVKAQNDGPISGASADYVFGRQDYGDFGPAHGKGSFIGGLGSSRKDHDSLIANFVFADGHVDSIIDANRDGKFSYKIVDGRVLYDELEGKVFGGWLNQPGLPD
ncbi:MAG TPA: type II secretion system protein [Phycisphaerales bacterium]|nr:type II secretion system protein [Phycisphaerales bacterium]